MTYRDKRLAHALHNEKVCNQLSNIGGCGDWVITTAFYSALHFVTSKIFPLQYPDFENENQIYNTFEAFFDKGIIKKSKHDVLHILVKKKCGEIAPEYRMLLDICKNSRYFEYEQCSDMVSVSKKSFKKIKDHCNP